MRKYVRFTVFLAGLLAVPAAAWACTGQPMVLGVNPLAAAPGEEVRLSGEAVATSPLQIHWNSATGPLVADVTPDSKGDFSVVVTAPEVAPGIYTLVLVSKADGSVGRTPLEVLPSENGRPLSRAPGVDAIQQDLWNGFSASTEVSEASAPAPRTSGAASGPMAAGAALLAFGTISLVALGAMARSRRKTAGEKS